MTRNALVRRGTLWAGAACLAGGATAGSLAWIEARHPQLTRIEICLPKLSARFDGFTIALLADLHYDSPFSASVIKSAVSMVNELRPDVIALLGDYVSTPVLGDGMVRRGSTVLRRVSSCSAD